MTKNIFDRLEEGFIAFLLAAMTALTFLQVVLRYVFNSGISWALEATTYLFGWLIFFGIAYGVKISSHIGVDAITKALPPGPRRFVGLVAVALSLVYCALVFYGAYGYISKMYVIGVEAEDMAIPRWMLLIILPLGIALTFVRFLMSGWRIFKGKQEGLKLADEAHEAIASFKQSGGTEDHPR